MNRYITDLDGVQIEVTDINLALDQAKKFSKFNCYDVKLTAYWVDVTEKLTELKTVIDAEPKIKIIPESINDNIPLWVIDSIPLWVINIREERRKRLADMGTTPEYFNTGKLFSKDGKKTPLYGIHSCVRAEQYIRKLEQMKVGETWYRFGSPNLTRIY